MRGVKKIEYRSGPTKIRGRILIYAGLKRYSAADEAQMIEEYEIWDVFCEELPRGVLVGTVELCDCDDGDWYLQKPERAGKLIAPKKQPQPVWFYPFRSRRQSCGRQEEFWLWSWSRGRSFS